MDKRDAGRTSRNPDPNGSAESGSAGRIVLATVLIGCAVAAIAAVSRSLTSETRAHTAMAPTNASQLERSGSVAPAASQEYFPARFPAPMGEATGHVKTFEHE